MSKFAKASHVFLVIALLVQWTLAWTWVPVDQMQGEVYRIIYLHVPSAIAAFFSAAVLLVACIGALKSKNESALQWARASTEVGLIFTVLTLATGSIWGKPTWGTWWTWDARLTTTLLLGLLYCGWLLLYTSLPAGATRIRGCAMLGIMIAADVPVIYKSVTWWRTLHQPQTILRPGGGATMEPEMLWVLLGGMAIMVYVTMWLIYQRRINIELQTELEQKSLAGVA